MTLPLPDANPLLEAWTAPFEAPPFDRIAPRHFEPAFEAALKEARAEIDAIAADPAAPTFANTIEAMERSGRTLDRVAKRVLQSRRRRDERRTRGDRARHRPGPLAPRERHLSQRRAVPSDRRPEGERSRRSGSRPSRRARFPALISISPAPAPGSRRRPRLGSPRSANGSPGCRPPSARTCWRTKGPGLYGSTRATSTGFRTFWVASAERLAAERGHPGQYAVTLSRSSVEPFLQFSARRDLREAAFRAWAARGENGGATDNRAIAAEMVRLRAERAKLLGYESHAHYRLADAMAKTPSAALDLLESVWTPAAAAGRTGSRGVAGDRGQRGRQFPRRAVGLALSRREAPQGGVRFRRERDKTLPPARPDDRRRLLRRRPAVRRELRRALRRAAAITRTRAPGRSPGPTARRSRSSSATISPGRRSAAAPG